MAKLTRNIISLSKGVPVWYMTRGPIFNPRWYCENLYPFYEALWKPLKKAGKKVVFTPDGKLNAVIDDVLRCGADGFFAEPHTDLEILSRRYGKTKVLIGNLDGRILEEGSAEDIRREVECCACFGRDCPGYCFCVGNHLTHTIPPENIRLYFQIAQELVKR